MRPKPKTLENIVLRVHAQARKHPFLAGALNASAAGISSLGLIELARALGTQISLSPQGIALESAVVGALAGFVSYAHFTQLDITTPIIEAANTAWKKIYTNPRESAITTGILAIPYTCGMHEAGYSPILFPFKYLVNNPDSITTQLIVCPTNLALSSYILLALIKQAGGIQNIFLNWIAADHHASRHHYHKAIAIRKRMVRDAPTNISYRLELIRHCINASQFDEALEQIKTIHEVINHPHNASRSQRIRRKVIAHSLRIVKRIDQRINHAAPTEGSILPFVTDAIIAQLRCDNDAAVQAWQRIIALYPDEKEPRFLYAQALDALKKPEMSKRQWTIGLEKLLREPEIDAQFSPVGIQRNEVFVYAGSTLIRNTIHFKRKIQRGGHPDGVADQLKKEHQTMTYLKECLGETIATSLGVFTYNHANYLIVKTAGVQTLNSLIETMPARKRRKILAQAAIILADIHSIGSAGLHSDRLAADGVFANTPAFYLQRSGTECIAAIKNDKRIILHPRTPQRITSALAQLTHSLCEVPHHFYKDHSPTNIIVSDLDELVCIDFETRKELACMIDLVTLLEFGRAYTDTDDQLSIVTAYFSERKKYTQDMPDQTDMMRWYHLCGLQRHLEIFGYRSRYAPRRNDHENQASFETIVFHRNQARSHTELFAKKYATAGEEKSARDLFEALSEIAFIPPSK